MPSPTLTRFLSLFSGVPSVVNALDPLYGVKGDGVTDDTTGLQAAITAAAAAGSTLSVPARSYIISSALTVPNGLVISGSGTDNLKPIIHQTSTTAHALTATNLTVFKMENIYLFGPSSGSGMGINFGITGITPSTNISIRDCRINHFGSDGLHLDTPIVTNLERVVALNNGGHGFYLGDATNASGGTSCSINSCYANNNAKAGYYFQKLQYSSLNGCAADSNGTGYFFDACVAMAAQGCGTESNTNKGGGFTGNGFVVSGGRNVGLRNCFVYQPPSTATNYWVTAGASNIEIHGCTDSGTVPTFSVLFDSGTSGSVMDITPQGPTSYPTTVNILPTLSNNPLPDDQALKAWAFDPVAATGATTTTVTGGVINLVRASLRTAQTVTNVLIDVSTAGVTLTTGQNFIGLYNSSGTLIATSADQTTAWGTTGYKTAALVGGPYNLAAGNYYVAFVANGTTPPAFARGAGPAGGASLLNGGLTSGTARFATNGTAQTTLPATITMGSNSLQSLCYWAGLS